METNKDNKQQKIWLNIVMVIIILFTLITVVGSISDFNQIFDTLKNVNSGYLMIALSLSLLSFLSMSLSSHIVLRALNKKLSLGTGFLIQTVEPFFNGITPFSSGAQPFQIYYYHKHGVDVDESTSVLIVNFILYQMVSVLLSTIGLIIYFDQIIQSLGNNSYYIIIGYSINTIILIGLFLLSYIKGVYIIFEKLFEFLEKFKLTRKLASKLKLRTASFVKEFQTGVRFLFTKKRVFITGSLLKLISLLLLYASTIYISYALGITIDSLNIAFYLIIVGVLAVTTMMFVPLPGASGGTEIAFTLLLGGMYTSIELVTLMLLWRLTTYYFGMIYGFVGFMILRKRKVSI